ncbi:MAG: hypothetical protein LBH91_04860 [Prevotellaceae bacterium]|jgi:hypothetical protein|nr:hypothetical protein [Prevotellaceae bacterium]
MKKLQCVDCGGDLEVEVAFDGCDWDSIKGEGSGYVYVIELYCECGRLYPIGRIKNELAFCENIERRRPYGKT